MAEEEAVDFLRRVGLCDGNLLDYSTIVRLSSVGEITNGLVLQLRNRLIFREVYNVVSLLVPEEVMNSDKWLGERMFHKRVVKIDAQYRKLRKRKTSSGRAAQFLSEPFNLDKSLEWPTVVSPRKKKLREEKKQLKEDFKETLRSAKKLKVSMKQQEIRHQLEMERVQSESAVPVMEESEVSDDTRASFSSYRFRRRVPVAKRTNVLPPCAIAKGNQTEISGVDQDIIAVTGSDRDEEVFEGARYFGSCSKRQNRRLESYARITGRQPNSSLTRKSLRERTKHSFDVLGKISGDPSDSSDEKHLLVVELMRQNPNFFLQAAAAAAGLHNQRKISPRDSISIKALARLRMNKIRDLRSCLAKLGCNFWPSEGKMRAVESIESSHVGGSSVVESGLMALRKTAASEQTEMLPFIRVLDLKYFLQEIFNNLLSIHDPSSFNDELWVLFSGDKGGGNMKFHVEFINSISSGSVDKVHLFCMFEGADTPENMWKVFSFYREQIIDIQKDSFCINGRKVKCFLGGDLHFIDDMLGHQGSAATYPSSLDLVTLDHLRRYGGKPHTPEDCPVQLRTVEDYYLNYNENLSVNRSNGNMRDNGRYHNSVVDQMLFPIKDLGFVVPPILHILLGITLLLYNLLLDFCKQVDLEEIDSNASEPGRLALMQELEESSMLLSAKCSEMGRIGEEVVEIENRIARIVAILDGDEASNLRIARLSEKSGSRRKVDKCSALVCCITAVDTSVTWVQCDSCDWWVHSFCECFTPLEELSVEAMDRYIIAVCKIRH